MSRYTFEWHSQWGHKRFCIEWVHVSHDYMPRTVTYAGALSVSVMLLGLGFTVTRYGA